MADPDLDDDLEVDEDDGLKTIRAKWIMDEAATLSEAAFKVDEFADWLRFLEKSGWELQGPVQDDYGFIRSILP